MEIKYELQVLLFSKGFGLVVFQVVNFFIGLLFLRLLEQLGSWILYSIFDSFSLMGFIFVKKNVIETKGKSLQEIEISFLPQVPPV